MPQFDILHVISDLHFGGTKTNQKNFQIFNQGKRLAAFINRLSEESPDKHLGLVLNGDIVDFLAENKATYLDTQQAVEKLSRIYHDDSFNMVWLALENFVSKPQRTLVLVLGNHDVELALPEVKSWLIDKLSNSNAENRGRIIYSVDGAGFSCEVGDKRVLCVHGNEVDEWNVVDYFQLLKVQRSLNRGNQPEPWQPNAGTQMVVDVMNEIKKDFPMVDLLKPEIKAVIPTILALDPKQTKKIQKILQLQSVSQEDKQRIREGLLNTNELASSSNNSKEQEELEKLLMKTFNLEQPDNVASLLMQANERIEKGLPASAANSDTTPLLGIRDTFQSIKDRVSYLGQKKSLQLCLKCALDNDDSFSIDGSDDVFTELDAIISPDIDYIIAGHTHLARAKPRRNGNGYYYNSGTWIRLIELKADNLNNNDEFDQIFKAFSQSDIEALDKVDYLGPAQDQSLVLKDSCFAVSVFSENKTETYAQLSQVLKNGQYQQYQQSRNQVDSQ